MRGRFRVTALVLSIVLTAAMAAAQILYCLHGTIMSPQHLSLLLEKDQKLAELTYILRSSLTASGKDDDEGAFLKQYMGKVLANTDQTWVKSQVYITAKGLHQYMFSDSSVLPTLDIIPLKKAITTVLISDIMESDQAKLRVEKIKAVLSALNNKYLGKIVAISLNNQLASMLLELSPIRSTGFDKASIDEIARIYIAFSNKSISLEQASRSIAEQMTMDALKLNQIRDYFDLNLFMDKAFGENNPLKIFKAFISSWDKTISLAVNIFLCGAILLLAIHKRLKPVFIIKTAARCFLAASLLVLCISLLLMNKPFVEGSLAHIYNVNSSLSNMLIEYSSMLIRDLGLYLSLQAIMTVLLSGITALLLSRVKAPDKKVKAVRLFPVMRISLAISVILIVFIVISSIALSNEYRALEMNLAKLAETDISQSIKQGLIDAGGMEFLEIIEKSK